MKLKEIAKELGILEYPEKLDEIYESKKELVLSFLDEKVLKEYDEKYNIFREHLDTVIAAAKEISANRALSTYIATVSEYVRASTIKEASAVPFPAVDLGLSTDMMRLFPLIANFPDMLMRYETRGFSYEEIKEQCTVFYNTLGLSKAVLGKSGYTSVYFGWTLLFIYTKIFNYGSFNFEFITLTPRVILLKNKNTGKHAVMMTERDFHRDGRVLGTPGFCDEEGSFSADFVETDEAYIGHTACDSLASREITTLKKSEWEYVAKRGDEVLSVHIPRGADLSPEAIWKSYEGGMKIARERFPEYDVKCLYCGSWLIDAQLEEVLGESSKIVGFGKTFLRYPISSDGRNGFNFIFMGYSGPDTDLPEDTSLQRKVKALYLNGGYTHPSGGFAVEY